MSDLGNDLGPLTPDALLSKEATLFALHHAKK
jgi:hypothetical protein